MPEYVVHHGLHVVRRDMIAAAQPRQRARHLVQPDRTTRADADLDPPFQVVVEAARIARGLDQRDDIALDRRADRDAEGTDLP